jgi:DNA-binding NarL/FixJ family response regulator
MAWFATWLIEREPFASIILDRRMRILLANAAARDLLQRTRQLEVRGTTLTFASKAHLAIIAEVLEERRDQATLQMRIDGKHETARVEAIPVGPLAGGYIMLTVAQPASNVLLKISRALRLTPAESEIALGIARGSSQRQIARMRGASINTIKTQVACIYHKVGVRSQAALASKIGEIR